MIAALAFLRSISRLLPLKAWLAVAVLAAFLIFGGYCAHRAAEGEKDRQAAERAETERRASAARETAADERLDDTLTIRDRQKEKDHTAQELPDGLPDERELRRRCRQLRDAGRELPACSGLGGPT